MAVLCTDAFSYANGLLPSPWVTVTSGTLTVASGIVLPTDPDFSAYSIRPDVAWPANQYAQVVQVELSSTNVGAGMGVILRCDGTADNLYLVVVNDGGWVRVGKWVAASFSEVANIQPEPFSPGDVMKAQVVGSTIKVFRNDIQIGGDVIDTSLVSGSAGIIYALFANTPKIDNFEGGDFGGPPQIPVARAVYGGWAW